LARLVFERRTQVQPRERDDRAGHLPGRSQLLVGEAFLVRHQEQLGVPEQEQLSVPDSHGDRFAECDQDVVERGFQLDSDANPDAYRHVGTSAAPVLGQRA